MIEHPVRPFASRLARRAVLVLLCGCASVLCARAASAQADDAVDAHPAVDPADAESRPVGPPEPGYQVSFGLSMRHATRDDFTRPVFLFQQPLQRLEVRELRFTLGLLLEMTPAIYLRGEVPLSQRQARARVAELVVSADEVLPPVSRELDAFGLADPTLAIGYRPLVGTLGLELEVGTTVPIDDNPEQNTFPEDLPLGTGQTELFGSLGPRLTLGGFHAAIDYRFSLYPGSPATYLVRRVGAQSYANGALDAFVAHAVQGRLAVELYEPVWLELEGDFSHIEQPRIVHQGRVFTFLPESHRDEIGAALALRFEVAPDHALTLRYRHLFLEAWNEDPFFPIAIPERGLTLAWEVWAR